MRAHRALRREMHRGQRIVELWHVARNLFRHVLVFLHLGDWGKSVYVTMDIAEKEEMEGSE